MKAAPKNGDPPNKPSDAEIAEVVRRLAPFDRRLILTGAGFSQPWGGYLTDELWSVIVSDSRIRGRPKVDRLLHRTFNFEEALGQVEVTKRASYSNDDREVLRQVVLDGFRAQEKRMRGILDGHLVITALATLAKDLATNNATKCIFTLNQDLLAERLMRTMKRPQVVVPGVNHEDWWFDSNGPAGSGVGTKVQVRDFDPHDIESTKGQLCYVKLHGSMNWQRPRGDVVVLGGAKAEFIKRFTILRLNSAIFREALNQGAARLLVIGYGFRDRHINAMIASAVDHGLRLWIVDPRPPGATLAALSSNRTWDAVAGYSSEPWIGLFDDASVERGMLATFWST